MFERRAEDDASYYRYDPSVAAAAIFAVLYGVAFILSVVQWIRFRPTVWLVMIIAGAMEAIGYISRTVSTQDVTARTPYVLQFSLLILAPVLMAGASYVLFGRIIFMVVPRDQRTFKVCWVPPRFVTPIFVAFDIIALLMQLAGAVMITSVTGTSKSDIDTFDRGRNLALAGVILQIVAFGIFTIAAIRFNFTSKKFMMSVPEEIEASHNSTFQVEDKPRKPNWPSFLRVVNFVTVMILIRSVYRLVEFTEGQDGYINTHEWCLYIFDALPIFPCVAFFVYWHPSQYLPYMGFRLPSHAR